MTDDNNLRNVRTETTTVNTDNPWPGLDFYREADQDFFHGRRQEIDELLRSVMRAQLTVFFGQSGLGKTSLLQAGLFPHLRLQNIFPVYIRLDFSLGGRSLIAQVKQIIAAEAAKCNVESPPGQEKETLWEFFHRKNADFWDKSNRIMLPLLVFDQFEEIFTLGRSSPDRTKACESFLSELGDLIEGRPPQALKKHLDANPGDTGAFNFGRHYYKVVLSLREEYIPDLEGLREQIPSIIQNRVRLHPMNGTSALEVVDHARHLIEPQVAMKVVYFVAAANDPDLALEKLEIEPALLSIVCRELNNKRQQLNEAYISEHLLEGSQEEILSNFYKRSVADLAPEVRAFVEEKLLTVSGYRDSIAIENAVSTPGVTADAIKTLVDRRLIRKEERGGMQRLELTHDLLTRVITPSRDRRHQLEKVKKREEEIAEKERQLGERARSARRLRWLLTVMTILFCAATIATIIALNQQKLAKKARDYANNQADTARKEQEKSQILLNGIMENVRLRQAILSRDIEIINQAFQTTSSETQIKFRATAEEKPYKGANGSHTYTFQMFPIEQSIPGGFESIALITYILDHPSFTNRMYATGPDTKFMAAYDGIGCLTLVTVLIEYSDPTKPASITKFNMCEILEIIRSR